MRIKSDMTLKTNPGPFRAVWRGDKTAELRLNDRDFQVNDRIELIEHDGHQWTHPYRRILVQVTHIARVNAWVQTLKPEEWVMLSFKVLGRELGIKGAKWARCSDCHQKKQVAA